MKTRTINPVILTIAVITIILAGMTSCSNFLDYTPKGTVTASDLTYAGVTWSNTGDRAIFIGWVNNWPEANKGIPSYEWRGGMTLPVSLSLRERNDSTVFVAKEAVTEIKALEKPAYHATEIRLPEQGWEKSFPDTVLSSVKISFTTQMARAGTITLSLQNRLGQHFDVTYDKTSHRLIIDRTHAGRKDFRPSSPAKHAVPVPDNLSSVPVTLFFDRSVAEVFFDGGRYLTTDLVFPSAPFNSVKIQASGGAATVRNLQIERIGSVWK